MRRDRNDAGGTPHPLSDGRAHEPLGNDRRGSRIVRSVLAAREWGPIISLDLAYNGLKR